MGSLIRALLKKSVTKSHCFSLNVVRLNHLQCYKLSYPTNFHLEVPNSNISKPHQTQQTRGVSNARFLSLSSQNEQAVNVRSWLKKLLLIGNEQSKLTGVTLYSSIEKVDQIEFMNLMKLADTFSSWFSVIELHTWILLFHLAQKPEESKFIRDGVIKAMWMDTEERAKMVAPNNKDYSKNIKDLYFKFRMTLLTYDEGFLSNDMVLSSALWCQFFNKNLVDPRCLEALVSFIRYQIHYMQSGNFLEEFQKSGYYKIWTPLKPHVIKCMLES